MWASGRVKELVVCLIGGSFPVMKSGLCVNRRGMAMVREFCVIISIKVIPGNH